MTAFLRFLSFVPPTLLFVLPLFSQVQGSLEQIPGDIYQVSITPSVNWMPPQSLTSSAQITLRASAGKLNVLDFQSVTGSWASSGAILSPMEAPDFDYFSFYLSNPLGSQIYQTDVPLVLFNFKNMGGCTAIELVDNQTDPFLPPNSMSVNIGNSFSILGAGLGQNAYSGNTANFSVSCPPLGIFALAQDNPVLCHGDETSITLQAMGGAAPYDIQFQNLTTGLIGSTQILDFEGDTILTGMPAGNYLFTVTDALDSLQTLDFSLTQPQKLTIELLGYDASCNGSMDGVALVDKVHGGTAAIDYTYIWSTNPNVSSPSIGFLDPGTYSVTVSDDNGCSASGNVEVNSFSFILPNPRITNITCHGADDGVIDLYPIGFNGPFTYEWSANAITADLSSAYHLAPGNYSVTIYDNTNICHEIATYNITEPPLMTVDYLMVEPQCYGDQGFLNILAVENNIGPWEASIAGSNGFSKETEFVIDPGKQMQLMVRDSNGCEIAEDFLIPDRPQMFLEIGENHAIKYGEAVEIEAQYSPVQNVTLEWSPSESLDCFDCPDPIAKPTENTTYRLQIKDENGCTLEDYLTIDVRKSRDIYIPTAFSPNHDGINDVFCPFGGFEITSIQSMRIFDRWGGLLYENKTPFSLNGPKTGWDGTSHGKDADTGLYIYTMDVEFIDGEVVLFKGEVNLLK